jgi:hypothetical protein
LIQGLQIGTSAGIDEATEEENRGGRGFLVNAVTSGFRMLQKMGMPYGYQETFLMRPGLTLLLLAGLFAPPFALLLAEEPATDRESAAALVARLRSDDFQEREKAAEALERLGAAALPALQAALKHPDAEVRRHAAELLRALECRVETARLLDAPRFRLQYRNVPLSAVLDDLSKRSGNPIKLDSTREELLKRPLTLTGEWTFWEALDRICEAGGLAEPEPEPTPPQQLPFIEEGFRGRRRVIFPVPRQTPEMETLTLLEAKPPARPTFQFGALRVRIFGPRANGPLDRGLATQHAPLVLEIKPEPRIGWEKLAAVRFERILDDRGQLLKLPPVIIGELKLPEYGDDVMVVWDGQSDIPLGNAPQRFALAIPVGDGTGKALREIRGTVAGWIRTAPEPLVTIDDLAKAVHRTQTGPEGCRLKVVECKREDDGLYKVQIDLTPPRSPSLLDLLQGRLMRPNRRFIEKVVSNVDAATSPFILSNEKSEALSFVNGTCEFDSNGPSRVYTLVYKPDKNDQGPAKLVYRDRRSAFVEIPFTLRDVPLYKEK